MKKVFKTRLAILLALILAFSFCINAYAVETAPPSEEPIAEEEIALPAAGEEIALPALEEESVLQDAQAEDSAAVQLLEEDSGDIGSIHWEYSGDPDCVLTFSGTGTIPNPDSESDWAWKNYMYDIEKIVFGSGITGIDDGAFGDMDALESIEGLEYLQDELVSPGAFTRIGDDYAFDENGNAVIGGILFAHYFEEEPEMLYVSEDIRAFGTRGGLLNYPLISQFSVDALNPYYSDSNGVLYNKERTKLIAYPCGSARSSFTIPNSVESFDQDYPLKVSEHLKYLTFGTALEDISLPPVIIENGQQKRVYPDDNVAQLYHKDFDGITVPAGNNTFASDDNGALYNKNLTTLYLYPKSAVTATIGSTVTTLAYRSFDRCTNLATLAFTGSSLQTLEGYALSDCDSLEEIYLPDSVTKVEDSAFAGSDNLQVHFTSSSVPEIGIRMAGSRMGNMIAYYPKDNQEWQTYADGEGQNVKRVQWVKEGEEVNPDLIDWGNAGTIHWELRKDYQLTFSGTGLIPSAFSIPGYAWMAYANDIQNIMIGDGITGMEDGAFYTPLTSLQAVYLPETLDEDDVSPGAFAGFGEDYAYDEDGNAIIAGILFGHHFASYDEPETLHLSKYVREIGTRIYVIGNPQVEAFTVDRQSEYLTAVNGVLYTKDLTELVAYPFGSENESLIFPDQTERIRGTRNFATPRELVYLTFGTGLNDLSVPSVDERGRTIYPEVNVGKLYHCYYDSITVPEGNNTFASDDNGALYDKNKAILYYYPKSAGNAVIGSAVTTIAYRSLADCDNLTSLVLPDTVQTLEGFSIADCDGLEELQLPASVKRVDGYAFSSCEKLKAVRFTGPVPQIDVDMAGYRAPDQDKLIAVYPNGNKAWSDYVNGAGAKVKNVIWRAEGPKKNVSTLTITLNPKQFVYDGKAKTPLVTVKDGTRELKRNTDFTVAYSNNTNAGTGKVTITGKGIYTGSITKTFTISKAANTLTVKPLSVQAPANASKPLTFKLKVTKAKGTLTFKSSNTKQVKVNKKGVVTIKKGAKAGKYVITVTANGNGNYLKGTKKVKITVGKKIKKLKKLNK